MNANRLEDLVVVGFNVGLVVDLDEHVAPTAFEQPSSGFVGSANDGGFVFETLILAKVEVAEDDGHAVSISSIEHALHAGGEGRAEAAIGLEGAVDPRLCFE